MPAMTADTVKANSFTFSARQPRKRVRLSASRTAISSLPYFDVDDQPGDEDAERQRDGACGKQRRARRVGLHVEAENILEIGQAVVAAETHVVAEEGEQQRIGHRLGDDRQIDAGDAAAEGEPAEHEGEQPRHQHHHQGGEPELVEAVPEPGQFLPVEEHHEVGQHRDCRRRRARRSGASDTCPSHSRRARRTRRGQARGCRNSPRRDRARAPAARSRDICRPAPPCRAARGRRCRTARRGSGSAR